MDVGVLTFSKGKIKSAQKINEAILNDSFSLRALVTHPQLEKNVKLRKALVNHINHRNLSYNSELRNFEVLKMECYREDQILHPFYRIGFLQLNRHPLHKIK